MINDSYKIIENLTNNNHFIMNEELINNQSFIKISNSIAEINKIQDLAKLRLNEIQRRRNEKLNAVTASFAKDINKESFLCKFFKLFGYKPKKAITLDDCIDYYQTSSLGDVLKLDNHMSNIQACKLYLLQEEECVKKIILACTYAKSNLNIAELHISLHDFYILDKIISLPLTDVKQPYRGLT